MESPAIVYYSPSRLGTPVPVRMLLFNNAIQLYDETGTDFLAAFPYQDIIRLSEEGNKVTFALLSDRSQVLEVPLDHFFLPELLQKTGASKKRGWPGWRKLQVPVFAILVLFVMIGGYYLLVASIARFGVQFISPKKEAELGQMMYNAMMEQEKIDTLSTAYVQQFAAPLKLSENYQIRITVVDEKEVNAFAIPGGNIVIYKGILKNMRHPGELVALLGHEASHVNERHSLRNILQEMTGSMLLSMVFGDLGSIGGAIAGRANMIRSLSYSRGLEEEADELGMERMLRNKVDPQGMVLLMDRLEESEKDVSLPGFLSTHPVTSARKAHAQKFVAAHPFREALPADLSASWKLLKIALADSDNW
ncbi:M48 family metallopeptidase [Flavihumibacter fluvii]|uniref:M48 family metallopeptidase n=1 Tax=Flavihumibacter fluvii TaxID=2838157 RepID=UPI001BDED563|nr:M48 family metallopeptidase [Flavihumibacter fluvii]ULQ53575.1 M48 family metallopeptidase [Flavihumibacter fluvii]